MKSKIVMVAIGLALAILIIGLMAWSYDAGWDNASSEWEEYANGLAAEDSSTGERSSDEAEPSAIATGPRLPEPDPENDCAANDEFFAKLMSQGYERAVFGFGENGQDIAVWRRMTREGPELDDLVLTVSGAMEACRVVGFDEQSAPAG